MKLKIRRGIILSEENLEDLQSIMCGSSNYAVSGKKIYTTETSQGLCVYIYYVSIKNNLITLLEVKTIL